MDIPACRKPQGCAQINGVFMDWNTGYSTASRASPGHKISKSCARHPANRSPFEVHAIAAKGAVTIFAAHSECNGLFTFPDWR